MLVKQLVLQGIADGSITAVYRRWRAPRVRAGSTFRTAAGVVEVRSIEPIEARALTDRHAREAGFASRAALLAELDRSPVGDLYRIALRLAGPDPRVALRADARLTRADVDAIAARLDRLDAASGDGPWTRAVLATIAERPGVRAGDLAADAGRERLAFNARVRRLKELGLTESLEVGYRLSPRGRSFLRALERRTPA